MVTKNVRMSTRNGAARRLHVEAPGCIINVETGRTNAQGQSVTFVDVVADGNHFAGDSEWWVNGERGRNGGAFLIVCIPARAKETEAAAAPAAVDGAEPVPQPAQLPPYFNPNHFAPGDRVMYGELVATIIRHYCEGMWEIRVPGGPICVSGAWLMRRP